MSNKRFLFCTGGCVSGIGKGISVSSLAFLMKQRGYSVQLIKFDPYYNISGSMNPIEHGETFLLNSGGNTGIFECDLDLGHYERIAQIEMTNKNICTSGVLLKEMIAKQESGKWLGQTVQVSPHMVGEVENRIYELSEKADITFIEIGGTIDDEEGKVFMLTARKFKQLYGDNCLIMHVAPILFLRTIGEWKTKPLQRSIKDLQSYGLFPDILICRSEQEAPEKILDKVSRTTTVPRKHVFNAPDCKSIYQVPIEFYDRHIDDLIVDKFRLNRNGCNIRKYKEKVERYINNDFDTVNIALVGKYANWNEAYLSIKEALFHSGLANDVNVNIKFIHAEEIENCNIRGLKKHFENIDGIVIPGGFDKRAINGKLAAARYARENKIPYLGLCLGLQVAVIEFAKNVCGIKEANSKEFDINTPDPVITYVEGQEEIIKEKYEGTMRLGAYDCKLVKDSLAHQLYGKINISERHRHRLEVNEKYVEILEKKGLKVSGRNPQTNLVEVVELDQTVHPYFMACQFHPEFKSRLLEASPLFVGLVKAAMGR